jgi:hypothetical protein
MESVFGAREFGWFNLPAAVTSSLTFVGLNVVTGDTRSGAFALRVDEIPQKIHDSGEESLTEEEHRFLAKESQWLKKRCE